MPDSSEGSACLPLSEADRGVSPSSPRTPPPAAIQAARVWAALAPLLAGRPRVRESRDGGRNYHARWERPLTDRLPRVPAAVPIYSGAGDTRVLVVDLDTARGGRETVERDAATITALVRRCGGALIADESPSGGIHLYLPLAQPVPFHDARDAALALAALAPCMDTAPNVNLLAGLIRPPGSVHKTGGHQTLRGISLDAAHRLATAGNPPAVWRALTAALGEEIAAVRQQRTSPTVAGDTDAAVARPGGPRQLTGAYLRIATTGIYDTARYRSPSEARQAVITSAAWAGWTLPQVIGRLKGGAWPGLAALYARYTPTNRAKALTGDWRKAAALVAKEQAKPSTERTVHKSPTSEPPSHRQAGEGKERAHESRRGTPAEYQFLRSWWTALQLAEHDRYPGRPGPAQRMVLRALGEAGMKTGSRYVAFGTRSVALATGLDHTTVAAHLRVLRDEDDPLIVLVENDRGLQGDLYELRIPDEHAARAARMDWPAGRIHALRPVFRALGLPAAYVYEALEAAKEPLTSFDLVTTTRIGRSSVYAALETLAAYNLAEQRDGHWCIVSGTSLAMLAEQLGCLEEIDVQLTRYRVERAAYRAALGIARGWPELSDPMDAFPYDDGADPPGGIDSTVLDLLQRRLGARIIA